ncbi:flagellar hook-associated protein 3 FlgL [Solimonas aquatica]|uniref:Flagellar hook-associated protein 3 FlgL n=1 Tax=Solimonas aquatica TaxID=489703 RepID=A0A1H9DZE3_9GAMM|nr:flagellar hook-associated protein FlgL [Solimonas aquatica]SEQ18844.1 flagellar hook-associated protein 3 FlgL [Solimonas aquatica]
MMRISTAALYQQSLSSMQMQTAKLAKTQNQLATEKKWTSAGDDPAGFANAQNLDQLVALNAQYTDSANGAQTRLQMSEDTVASAVDLVQHARELVIQANSASQSNSSRATIAQQLSSVRDQLLALANTGDGQGRYLFGGAADGSQPFSWNGSSADYHGDSTVVTAQVGTARFVAQNDPGSSVFQGIAVGNGTYAVSANSANTGTLAISSATVSDASAWDGGTYTLQFTAPDQYQVLDASNAVVSSGSYSAGSSISFKGTTLNLSGTPAAGDEFSVAPAGTQDVFSIVDQLATLLSQPQDTGAQRAQVQTALQQGLNSLQTAETHLTDVRGSIGTRMNSVTDALSMASSVTLSAQTAVSDLRDLDYAEAVTRLQQQMTALQAAQQTYTQVRNMSLFQYLR